ncbi:MAG: hypothetical protein AVDCRST_MAG95-3153 [uncultured Adhaeribacter sp.]|uniref:N-acetyltransferase domain-containing protein n=1 Tax=uncultured Adhaeribacter sp. TaxID=448109 RepID=A0A6J4JFF6_9BACT|nr:MAG: hypothetical protein AVDCRST_MAG95-3153 [uncultured Adhaeribacter sp.]
MPKPTILFRADGNSQIGLGHVVRSLALAEMLLPDFICIFAIQEPKEALARQITDSGCHIEILPFTSDYLREAKQLGQQFGPTAHAVVLDGYQFPAAYQTSLRRYFKTVCLDDIHAIHFVADAIINPAGAVPEKNYLKENYTHLYAGPEYALLRAPFLAAARQIRSISNSSRFFLNLGGADPHNDTLRLLEQLISQPGVAQIETVVGSAYPFLTDLKDFAAQNPSVRVHRQLSAEDMCRLMQTCDAAILPPSTVAYEWCSVGGPLFLYRTAANQKNLEQFLLQHQLAFSYADLAATLPELTNNTKLAQDQLQKQRTYFDGKSSNRLRKIFHSLIYPDLLFLRKAQPSDLMLLFDWINEPAVRQFSLNPAPVPLAMHTSWYQHKLTDKNCFIFIAELRGVPAGMIRFDLSNQEAIISYLLAEEYRGKGLGVLLLQKGLQSFRMATTRFKTISALVQQHNIASVRAFEKAGFTAAPDPDRPLSGILKFTLPA